MRQIRPLLPLILAASVILSAALGIRQTFGLFVGPIAGHHLVDVALLSLALAIQNLIWGLAQPLAGALTDRFGPARVVAAGGVMTAFALLWVALAPSLLPVMLGLGILVGLGQAAMTFAVVISSVSRGVNAAQRATTVALASAGGSLGQVGVVPIAQLAIDNAGFQHALVIMCVLALAAAPLGLLLRGDSHGPQSAEHRPATGAAIRGALRDANFLFLTAGFFACGFQLAFMGVHLPGYLAACHLPAGTGAAALMCIGFFNIIGSFAFGKAADRVPPQLLLSALYAVRATATMAYLVVPISVTTTIVFAVTLGLTWLGTVPLTNAVIARLHGLPNLGALFGLCFVGHQLGAFLGALAGGLSLQLDGSYTPVWLLCIVIGYAAALLNLPIRLRTIPAAAAAA